MKKLLPAACIALLAPFADAHALALTSVDIQPGMEMPSTFVQAGSGCTGGNASPQLSWSDAPQGTQSFAVTMYDPDAPTGSGWWHWSVVNIPASVHSLARGAGTPAGSGLPAGATQGRTDFAGPGYGGACPPPGDTHRYRFKIWALKVARIEINGEMSAAQIGYMLGMNALDSAELIAISTHVGSENQGGQ